MLQGTLSTNAFWLPGHIISWGILCPRAWSLWGMLSTGQSVSGACCILVQIVTVAGCLRGRLSLGYCLRGILSLGHIVSGHIFCGADCLRGGWSAGRMVCEADGLWDGLSAGRIVCGANCLGPCEHRCLEAKLPSPKLNHWNPSLKFSNLADWILFQKITTTRPQHNGSNI